MAKTVNGQTTHYLYDQAGQLIAEFDAASGLPRVEYVWLDDLPVAMFRTATDSPGVYFIHSDHLNTPTWVSNPWGSAVWAADYRPFGQAAITNATLSFHLRFPGQYHDPETGLHYNWHRYYDPSTGRYITSDPIGLAGGLNTYAYAGGSPLRNTDPEGLLYDSTNAYTSAARTATSAAVGTAASIAGGIGLLLTPSEIASDPCETAGGPRCGLLPNLGNV